MLAKSSCGKVNLPNISSTNTTRCKGGLGEKKITPNPGNLSASDTSNRSGLAPRRLSPVPEEVRSGSFQQFPDLWRRDHEAKGEQQSLEKEMRKGKRRGGPGQTEPCRCTPNLQHQATETLRGWA